MEQNKSSVLERRFKHVWRSAGGPELLEEFRFHPKRKWRADFCHEDSMTLIECEGGVWVQGRHNRPEGFIKDAEKYLEAALLGYRVIRLTREQITVPVLTRIAQFCRNYSEVSDGDLSNLLAD